MDADSSPTVDARRRRALLVAILAFPIVAGLVTWGAAGLGVLPGGVQLEQPQPAVVPAGPEVPSELVVLPPVDPGSTPGAVSTVQAPPPPVAVPPPGPTGPAGGTGPTAGGAAILDGPGSSAPDPRPAGSGPPSPGGTAVEPRTAGSDDDERDDDSDDNQPNLSGERDDDGDDGRDDSGRDDDARTFSGGNDDDRSDGERDNDDGRDGERDNDDGRDDDGGDG